MVTALLVQLVPGVYPTLAGARVKPTRIDIYKRNEMPAITVYTLREPVNPDSQQTAPAELERDCKMDVVGSVPVDPDADDAQDQVDELARQIESVVGRDPSLGNACESVTLEETVVEFLREGDVLVGRIVMTYSVIYRTQAELDAPIDDFLRATVTTQVNGAVQNPIVEQINIREST